MSGAAIARNLLINSAGLTALVPSTRIIAGVIPQATALPCIGITEVSSTDRHTLKGGAFVKVTELVQITVLAATYPACKAALSQVRKAGRNYVGDIGNYTGITCHLDNKGPDFQSDTGFCAQSQDYRITFTEAA